MAWFLRIMTYNEFSKLVVCFFLDIIEYVIPFLLQPLIGDMFDFIGLATCIYFFRWIGLFAVLELIPGFDFLPINLLTWLIWFIVTHREDFYSSLIES